MEHQRLFGLPFWTAVVVLGAAAVVAYLLFRGRGGGGAAVQTTGPSAQGLAVMANPDYSASIAQMNQELFAGFGNVQQSLEGLNTNIQAGNTGVLNTLTGLQGDISEVGGQVQQVYQLGGTSWGNIIAALGNLSNQQTGNQQANNAYYLALIHALQQYANAQQSQVSKQINWIPVPPGAPDPSTLPAISPSSPYPPIAV